METLAVLEDLAREDCIVCLTTTRKTYESLLTNSIALEVLFDALECALHVDPKVDLLDGRSGGGVTLELGHLVHLLDPAVDTALELVHEARVGEKGRINLLDGNLLALGVALENGE